ncbi:hypothetical protein PMAYCL1PPCAC_32157, partial [Pristionchus mayeri]
VFLDRPYQHASVEPGVRATEYRGDISDDRQGKTEERVDDRDEWRRIGGDQGGESSANLVGGKGHESVGGTHRRSHDENTKNGFPARSGEGAAHPENSSRVLLKRQARADGMLPQNGLHVSDYEWNRIVEVVEHKVPGSANQKHAAEQDSVEPSLREYLYMWRS